MTKADAAHRYAIYFAPRPESPWWQAGSQWLGRCAVTQQALAQPTVPGMHADVFYRLTASPRRYGWHATLKAPFVLAEGVDRKQLSDAVRRLAHSLSPFDLPILRVSQLDDFLALVPATASPAIDAVARACVTDLHDLAAPLPPAELQRRRAAGLTRVQEALLLRWGYPFVLDAFHLHLSLTGSMDGVEPAQVQTIHEAARQWFGPLLPCRFDSLALFVEPAPGAEFVLLEHAEFGA